MARTRRLYLAIDDVELRDGVCPHFAACSFEDDDFCLWENELDLDIVTTEWVTYTGASSEFGSGPSVDHTHGTPLGRYIYFQAFRPNERALLRSPLFDQNLSKRQMQPTCFEFWYYMLNCAESELNVYVEKVKPELESIKIWSLKGSQDDVWRKATIPLNTIERFSVSIEAFLGVYLSRFKLLGYLKNLVINNFKFMLHFKRNDMALDDFLFSNDMCDLTPDYAAVTQMASTTITSRPFTSSQFLFLNNLIFVIF